MMRGCGKGFSPKDTLIGSRDEGILRGTCGRGVHLISLSMVTLPSIYVEARQVSA